MGGLHAVSTVMPVADGPLLGFMGPSWVEIFAHIPPSKVTFVFSSLCSPAICVCDIPVFGKFCYVDVLSNKNNMLN